jgi:hypothetical protein
LPEAVIWHKVEVSPSGKKSVFCLYYMTRNGLLLMKKHTKKNKLFFYILFGCSIFKRAVRILISEKKGCELAKVNAIKNGVLDFLGKRYGKRY